MGWTAPGAERREVDLKGCTEFGQGECLRSVFLRETGEVAGGIGGRGD